MLQIRQEQMEVLSLSKRKAFEKKVLGELWMAFPDESEVLGKKKMTEEVIPKGIDKASEFGIEVEDDVRSFMELVILLGTDFEKLPEFSWELSILSSDQYSGSAKMVLIKDKHNL